jgi:hypothetical protein
MKLYKSQSGYSDPKIGTPFFGKRGDLGAEPFFQPKSNFTPVHNEVTIQRQETGESELQDISEVVNSDAGYTEIASDVERTFPSGLTDAERGYTNYRHGDRLRDRLYELDSEEELHHIEDSFQQVLEGLGGARYLDCNLSLAIAFRESGQTVLSRRAALVNTFRRGGLDRLYHERQRLSRRGFIPRRITDYWARGESDETEGSTDEEPRMSEPAMIPERDLLTAYAGIVSDRRERVESLASRHHLSTVGISVRASRIWTALCFGGPGGLGYNTYIREARRHGDDEGWIGSHFGVQTILSFFEENSYSLSDIVNLETLAPDLYRMTRTMSAFIVVAEAEVLDQILPMFANTESPDDNGISVGE